MAKEKHLDQTIEDRIAQDVGLCHAERRCKDSY